MTKHEKFGVVQSVSAEKALVRCMNQKACSSCGQKSSCASSRSTLTYVDNPIGARPGDLVRISAEGISLLYSVMIFLCPLLLAFFIILALPSHLSEALKAAVLFLSLALLFVIFTFIADRVAKKQYRAVITAVEHRSNDSVSDEREI